MSATEYAEAEALCLEAMICGNLSCDQPCPPEYPPAVCLLDPGHESMHTNGNCSWAHPGEAAYNTGRQPE